ncbi:diphthine methyl ester synthase-like [Zophobas morio]|uniref:diphthine methyl ester synthase-like n=1 Tax=Zophobas morio TaxID=2755281 RepID=UPI003083212F
MLYFIGLGLSSVKDITVRGLELVKSCDRVYLETYTSILGVQNESLEEFTGKKIILADRTLVEQDSDQILEDANEKNIAFLVVGDPFGATTHTDLWIRAKEKKIPVKIIHNASIINAVGCTGLQLYRFGEIISMVFFTETWKPDSFYDKLKANRAAGLHTLCLLDLKVKEQSVENLLRNRVIFEPPRFMKISECIEQLLFVEAARKENVYDEETLCVGVARLQSDSEQIIFASLGELKTIDFGSPLHSLLITGVLNENELEMLKYFATEATLRKIEALRKDRIKNFLH